MALALAYRSNRLGALSSLFVTRARLDDTLSRDRIATFTMVVPVDVVDELDRPYDLGDAALKAWLDDAGPGAVNDVCAEGHKVTAPPSEYF